MTETRTNDRWPEGLEVEFDEDGQTQAGSTSVKRAVIDHFQAHGYRPGDLAPTIAALQNDFPEEFGEVVEQFECDARLAYR